MRECAWETERVALELDPGCVSCYIDRGAIYLSLEYYDSALQDFNRAIDLDSSSAVAW